MAAPSAKSFLKILERSGIVQEDRLKQTLAELSQKFNGKSVKVDDLTNHLVDSGILTQWHCDKLLAGKYKGFFLGKYKLLGHLGTGGMSSVYLAEHRLSGQKRAIKVLPRKKVSDKSYLDRFYLEGRAAASLNDPNIVRIYDICNEADTHYMVMEWVDGIDLHELVKKDGPLSFDDATDYIMQAAVGLSHAHDKNLVHRDIKPANLLLARDGNIKILDLGLALVREETESLTVLYNEKVMGTADYLAPEQAVNSHEVDHRADIYSLGCTLYYLLTGHPPFPEGSLAQRIAMHQTKEPAPISASRKDCPPEIAEICNRMMAKDPDKRIQDSREVERILKTYRETGKIDINDSPEFSIDTNGRSSRLETTSSASLAPSPGVTRSGKNDNSLFAVSKSRSPHSNLTETKSKSGSLPSSKKIVPRKKKPAIPIWVLILIIAFMFIALIGVLAIAIKFGVDTETPAPESVSGLATVTSLFDDLVG